MKKCPDQNDAHCHVEPKLEVITNIEGANVGRFFVKDELLGMGGFGTVRGAFNGFEPCAIKWNTNRAALHAKIIEAEARLAHRAHKADPEHTARIDMLLQNIEVTRNGYLKTFDPNRHIFLGGELGQSGIVMEKLTATSVDTLRCDDFFSRDIRRVLKLGIDVFTSLEKIHRAGLVHRDLGATNLLCTKKEESLGVKIIDFGIAKMIGDESEVGSLRITIAPPTNKIPGSCVTPQDDLYMAAATLYACAERRSLYTSSNPASTRKSTHQNFIETALNGMSVTCPIGAEKVRDKLKDILLWCMQFDPDDRPSHAGLVADALKAAFEKTT